MIESFSFFLKTALVYKLVRFYDADSREQYVTVRATLTTFSKYIKCRTAQRANLYYSNCCVLVAVRDLCRGFEVLRRLRQRAS
jgi:hypothetical protein